MPTIALYLGKCIEQVPAWRRRAIAGAATAAVLSGFQLSSATARIIVIVLGAIVAKTLPVLAALVSTLRRLL